MIHEKINGHHPQPCRLISCLGCTALGILIWTTDQINMASEAERGEEEERGDVGGGGRLWRRAVWSAPEVPRLGPRMCHAPPVSGRAAADGDDRGPGQRAPGNRDGGGMVCVCVCVSDCLARAGSFRLLGMLLPALMKLVSHRVMSAIAAVLCSVTLFLAPFATLGVVPAITDARRH